MTGATPSFLHEALFYAGDDDYIQQTLPFVRDGIARDEAVLVVAPENRLDQLRHHLGPVGDGARFRDVAELGPNPATFIPVWTDFVDESVRTGRPCRGLGEPAWSELDDATLDEFRIHETLVNMAFDNGFGWRLLCTYDTEVLPPSVIDDAVRTHPFILDGESADRSPSYRPISPLAGTLPPPPTEPTELTFAGGSLHLARAAVAEFAEDAGLGRRRSADLVLAVNELVGNSIRHGGGEGVVRLWADQDSVVCEVSDEGLITDPLVGRRRPEADQDGGRGLWIANHLCDLVRVRSAPGRTVVRVHVGLSNGKSG